MARRAASICRFDIHAASIAWRPKSPNATVAPRVAMPVRRPRCILRYLTRLGISIQYVPSLRDTLPSAVRLLRVARGPRLLDGGRRRLGPHRGLLDLGPRLGPRLRRGL